MTRELVSIIIPIYNGEEFLEQALESVRWQTYANWECILLDDGSTDRTAEICRSWAERDPRFHYHRQENRGLAAARNAGVREAKGSFVQFLDDDDLLLPERLVKCLDVFQREPEAGVVYSDYVCYRPGEGFSRTLPSKIPGQDAARALLFEQAITFATYVHVFLFRKEVVGQYPFDESLHSYCEDVECWVRVASGGVRFSYIDDVLVIYRFSPGSLIANESRLMSGRVTVLRGFGDHPLAIAHRDDYGRAITYWRQRLAMACFMEKRFSDGRKIMQEIWGVSRWPAQIKMLGWWILMHFGTKETIVRLRSQIVRFTPFRWGGWKQFRAWDPPGIVRKLIGIRPGGS